MDAQAIDRPLIVVPQATVSRRLAEHTNVRSVRDNVISMVARSRTVHSYLPISQRRCLYCLGSGTSTQVEHVIQARFGDVSETAVIPIGGVCDICNSWLGRQVDAPFTDRFDITIMRALHMCRGRSGLTPKLESRDAIAEATIEVDGRAAQVQLSSLTKNADGGCEFEIRPKQLDPEDIVARTVRAMWKMALGLTWLYSPGEALRPEWDPLRRAVLGYPFSGFLLQRRFVIGVSNEFFVHADLNQPHEAMAMRFGFGGVRFAVPLKPGKLIQNKEFEDQGWDVLSTRSKAPKVVRLRLDPGATDTQVQVAA